MNNNVKISEQIFVETIEAIKKGLSEDDAASAAIETIIDGYAILKIGQTYLNALITLLEETVGDEDEMISWWLFEDVKKEITILPYHKANKTGKEIVIDVSSPQKLYQYFVEWN